MRWLKKREFMVFAYLSMKHGGSSINLLDAVFDVRNTFAMSTKTARNIVRGLIKAGYIVKTADAGAISIRPIEDVLSELVGDYITKRTKRLMRGSMNPRGPPGR